MAKKPEDRFVSRKHQARLERENIQRSWIRIGTGLIIALVAGLIIFGLLDQFVLKENKAVATVNGQKITFGQLKEKVRFNRFQLVQQYKQTLSIMEMFGSTTDQNNPFFNRATQLQDQLVPANALQIGKDALEQLISEAVIAQVAKSRGITVSDKEVDKFLSDMYNYYPEGTPTPAPTAADVVYSTLSPIQLTLAPPTVTPTAAPTEVATTTPVEITPTSGPTPTITASPTPYTQEGYQKQLKDSADALKQASLSEKDLRDAIYYQLLREKVTNAITSDVKAEEEQVWARHILVKDQTTGITVLDKVKAGEDWAALAAQYSTDTSNKDKGGDLGWFGKGKMVAAFEKSAFALEIGATSPEPVQTDFGFHIIQVLGHEVRPLSSTEYDNLKNTKFSDWVQNQITTDKVTRNDFWQSEVPTEPGITAATTP